MNWLWASIEAHPFGWSIGGLMVFTGVVGSMPPIPQVGVKVDWFRFLYQWAYDFLHIMSNQFQKLADEKLKARGVGVLSLPGQETAAVQKTTTTQETTAVSVAQS